MNVYDFDNTIYNGDSSIDLYFFMLKKYPTVIFLLPFQVSGFIRYKFGLITKERFKEIFFSFLKKSTSVESDVQLFWDKNENKLKKWYLDQQEYDDVIISASPKFLLTEICRRKGITTLIATDVDPINGKFRSENCFGINKIKRFKEVYPNKTITNFYSDSHSDDPLASIAEQAFIVKGGKISKWNPKK